MTTTDLAPRLYRRSPALAEALLAGARRDGGATLATVPGVRVPSTGYLCGVRQYGATIPADAPDALARAERWLRRVRAVAALPSHYVGSWRAPDGSICLDVVRHYAERATAVLAGRQERQHSIYSLTDGAEILCASDLLVKGA